jgi:hypothetical protein
MESNLPLDDTPVNISGREYAEFLNNKKINEELFQTVEELKKEKKEREREKNSSMAMENKQKIDEAINYFKKLEERFDDTDVAKPFKSSVSRTINDLVELSKNTDALYDPSFEKNEGAFITSIVAASMDKEESIQMEKMERERIEQERAEYQKQLNDLQKKIIQMEATMGYLKRPAYQSYSSNIHVPDSYMPSSSQSAVVGASLDGVSSGGMLPSSRGGFSSKSLSPSSNPSAASQSSIFSKMGRNSSVDLRTNDLNPSSSVNPSSGIASSPSSGYGGVNNADGSFGAAKGKESADNSMIDPSFLPSSSLPSSSYSDMTGVQKFKTPIEAMLSIGAIPPNLVLAREEYNRRKVANAHEYQNNQEDIKKRTEELRHSSISELPDSLSNWSRALNGEVRILPNTFYI